MGLVMGWGGAASLALTGCGSGGGAAADPDKAGTGFIDEVKKGNVEAAQAYLLSPESGDGMDTLTQAESGRIKESAASMNYTISSSTLFEGSGEATEDGQETQAEAEGALVVVDITNKDMAKVSEKLAATMQAEAGNFAAMSAKDMEKFWDNAIKDAISQTSATVTSSVDFVVVKGDGGWKIREADGFSAAVFGAGAILDF